MATSFNKTYSLQVKFSYTDSRAITDADMNVAEMRTKIKKIILEQIGSINKGDLNVFATGAVSEA